MASPTFAERLQDMGRAALDAVRGKEQAPAPPPLEKVATIPVAPPAAAPAPSVEAVFAANQNVAAGLRGVSNGTQVDVEPAGGQFARQPTPRATYEAAPSPAPPTQAEQLAAGKGLTSAKQPEPAKEREYEKA
jgi:hypothetical protein